MIFFLFKVLKFIFLFYSVSKPEILLFQSQEQS